MKNLSQSFKLGMLILGLTSMSVACSSSKVDDAKPPVETAGDASTDKPAEAATDAVPPPADAEKKTPDALAASPDAVVPPAAGAVPGADPTLEAPGAVAGTPVADAPIADAPVADAPVGDAPITDSAIASAPPVQGNDSSASSAPAPASDTSVAAAPSGDGVNYRVKKGDTLMKIAFEQYGDLYRWKEIYKANRANIQDPNHVPPGTMLNLAGAGMVTIEKNGNSYLIKHGDTLGVISNDVYGTIRKWKKLWENNRQLIKDPNKIYAGFYLYYVPESKLTHEDVAPGLKKEDSAANVQKVSAAPRMPASVVPATGTTPVMNVPVTGTGAPSKN